MGLAITSSFGGLVILAYAAFGGWQIATLRIGADPRHVNEAVVELGAKRKELALSLLATLADQIATNEAVLERRHRLLGVGLFGLVFSGLVILVAVAYITGVRILV